MNTHDIMMIRSVYENGSIAKSAAQLYMTPQSISVVIKRVESELGISLFQRWPGGMQPTYHGHLFYEKSERLIEELNDLADLFRLDIHNHHGVMHVGISQGIIMMLGISYISGFKKSYPNFRIEIIEGSDKNIEELVNNGTVDFGIAVAPLISNKFHIIPWCSFRCCAVIRTDSDMFRRFQGCSEISIAELKDVPIVLENKDFSSYREFGRICRMDYGFEPNIYFETTEIENALSIATDGHAIAVVPLPVARNAHLAHLDNVNVVGMKEKLLWEWVFIHKPDNPLTEIEYAFISHLTSRTTEMGWN